MKSNTIMACIIMLLLLGTSSLAGVHRSLTTHDMDASAASAGTATITFQSTAPVLTETAAWMHPTGEARMLMHPGCPLLPYQTETLRFPAGTRITDVAMSANDLSTARLRSHLQPAPQPVAATGDERTPSLTMGKPYTQDILYPEAWLTYRTGIGIQDGERALFLTLQAYPHRYHPGRMELVTARTIDVVVTYEAPVASGAVADDVDLLVLCPGEWTDELQPLAGHKQQHGVATVIVSLDDIYDGVHFPVEGRDSAEQIKYFIKNAAETWGVTYVMLVGGYNAFPMRETYIYDRAEERWLGIPVPTDLYYADFYDADMDFASWDTNGNGRYGEFAWPDGDNETYDEVDLYADVYLGRLACDNAGAVTTLVDKIIAYENTAYGQRWFNRVLCVAGDDAPNDGAGDVDEGIILTEASLEYLPGFRPLKLYPSRVIPELRLNSVTITAALSLGVGFAHFSGHGNMVAWSTHPHGDSSQWIGNVGNDLFGYLRNGDRMPVARITACLCAALDYSDPCLAWAFVAEDDGGAVATVASTRLSYFYIGRYVDQGLEGLHGILFFKGYMEGTTPGEMLVSAHNEYLATIPVDYDSDSMHDVKTVEEFILLGDPSLKIGGYQ